MKRILETILNELRRQEKIQKKERILKSRRFGLCVIAGRILCSLDREEFKTFLRQSYKNKKVFFDFTGAKVTDSFRFYWLAWNFKSREKWLLKSIKGFESKDSKS